MHRHNDAFGYCPRCNTSGWHRYKGKALIFGNTRKFKVSLFKCRKCGKKFGFDLSDPIPKPEPKISMTDRLLGHNKEEEKDEFDALLEALNDDYDKDFKITPDEVSHIISELEVMAAAIDAGGIGAANSNTILIAIKRICDILEEVTTRG